MRSFLFSSKAGEADVRVIVNTMSRKCVVPNCQTANLNSGSELHDYHYFPRCIQLRTKWLDIIGLRTESYRSWFRICSGHFEDSDYDRDLRAELTGIYKFSEYC